MTNIKRINQEVAKAEAHFATISASKIRDLEKIARIISQQARRGHDECEIARAIAAAARAAIRRQPA